MKYMIKLVFICAFALSTHAAAAGPEGQGEQKPEGSRVWPGIEAHKCGADIDVIVNDRVPQRFFPPAAFTKLFSTKKAATGETDRDVIELAAVLAHFGGNTITLVDCGNIEKTVSKGDIGRFGLMISGRGPLKLIEARENANPVKSRGFIKEIRIKASSPQ